MEQNSETAVNELLDRIRKSRTGKPLDGLKAELARQMERGILSIDEIYEPYCIAIRETAEQNLLVTDGPVKYVHGLAKEEAESTPANLDALLARSTPLGKRELPGLVNAPRPLFYEEYTLDPKVITVGATTGEYTRHSTLIFRNRTLLGIARSKRVFIDDSPSSRPEQDYPQLMEEVEITLGGKSISRTLNHSWIIHPDVRFTGFGVTDFDTLPESLERKTVTPAVNDVITSHHDPDYVLSANLDDPKALLYRKKRVSLELAEELLSYELRGQKYSGSTNEAYSILEKHNGVLVDGAVRELIAARTEDYSRQKEFLRVANAPFFVEILLWPFDILQGRVRAIARRLRR